jgi:hypothetical protein
MSERQSADAPSEDSEHEQASAAADKLTTDLRLRANTKI